MSAGTQEWVNKANAPTSPSRHDGTANRTSLDLRRIVRAARRFAVVCDLMERSSTRRPIGRNKRTTRTGMSTPAITDDAEMLEKKSSAIFAAVSFRDIPAGAA